MAFMHFDKRGGSPSLDSSHIPFLISRQTRDSERKKEVMSIENDSHENSNDGN